jgi:hypothetical protein
MPHDLPKDFAPSNRPKPADGQTKKMAITHELVMALADRVYAMLIHEMKIESERQRFPREFHRR